MVDPWPMKVEIALMFTPASINSDANVCRASCNPIGVSETAALSESVGSRPRSCSSSRAAVAVAHFQSLRLR